MIIDVRTIEFETRVEREKTDRVKERVLRWPEEPPQQHQLNRDGARARGTPRRSSDEALLRSSEEVSRRLAQNSPTAVVRAKTRKRPPPTKPMTRSDRYFEMKEPPRTAMPVAAQWPAMAPKATRYGFCAAASAMVAI